MYKVYRFKENHQIIYIVEYDYEFPSTIINQVEYMSDFDPNEYNVPEDIIKDILDSNWKCNFLQPVELAEIALSSRFP